MNLNFLKKIKSPAPLNTFENESSESAKSKSIGLITGFVIQDMEDNITTVITALPESAINEKAIEFQEFILDKIERGKKNIIIELTHCELIESTFLGAMVLAQRKIAYANGNLCIILNDNLKTSPLIFTDLNRLFNTFSSLSEAMERLK